MQNFLEAGSGDYTGQFEESPFHVSRSGISQLGDFVVGSFTGYTSINENESYPNQFRLNQNYPNPFNPKTTINFTIPRKGNVDLTVFNILGEKEVNLISTNLSAGEHQYNWDAGHLSSGIYFLMLKFENSTQVKKALLLK